MHVHVHVHMPCSRPKLPGVFRDLIPIDQAEDRRVSIHQEGVVFFPLRPLVQASEALHDGRIIFNHSFNTAESVCWLHFFRYLCVVGYLVTNTVSVLMLLWYSLQSSWRNLRALQRQCIPQATFPFEK